MKVAMINSHEKQPDCTHWSGVNFGMKNLGIDYYQVDCTKYDGRFIVQWLKDIDPDFIIYGLTDPIYQGYYREIRQNHTCPIAMWYCDAVTEETGNYMKGDMGDFIDVLFLSNDGQKEFYKKNANFKRVVYVPQAVVPVDEIRYNPGYDHDVIFIGAKDTNVDDFYGKRAAYLNYLKENIEDFCHLNSGDNDERMRLYREMPLYYGSSKICMDISRDWDIHKYASNRYFVLAGYGGLGLCKRFSGCEEIYPEGVGKVYFDTKEEALEKARYYIKNKEERMKIKQAGLEWTKKYHTYPIRITKMLKECSLL